MTPAQRDEFITRIDERTMQTATVLKELRKEHAAALLAIRADQARFDDRLVSLSTELAKEIAKLSKEHGSRLSVLETDSNSHKSIHRWSNARSIAFGVVTTIAGALGIKTLEGTHW